MQEGGFDVAGSFLLRSLVKPSLNVDLALRMPSGCIVPRDSLNYRYLDKRALYAGHLAAAAMEPDSSLGKMVDKVEVRYSSYVIYFTRWPDHRFSLDDLDYVFPMCRI